MFQSVAAGRSRMGAKRSIVKENKNGRQNSQNAEKRSRKRKNPKAVRQLTAIYVALVLVAVGAIGGGVFWAVHSTRVTEELIAENTQESTTEEESTVPAAIEETEETQDTEPETETETETETEMLVELTEDNIDGYVKVESCKIAQGTGTFSVRASVEEKPASDDDNFYLLKMNMYDTELDAGAEPIASVPKDKEFSLTANVNENQVDSRLMSKFVVAVKLKDAYVPLCDPCYMTNPEVLASYQAAYPQRSSIKGILVDPLRVDELDELHVNHAAYNIPVGNILGETTNGLFPTVYYTYDGRTYAFNGQRIAEYDSIFSRLTAKGITISAILLNNKSSAYPELTHPLSRGGSANYYAFNAAEADGVETLAAVGAFLAQRYRDNDHGIVMNWIVGNEVNVRSDWNYMQYVDLDTYAREYANAVRVFYNSIKSMNANARVYVSMDQQWNRDLSSKNSYDVRDLLVSMNQVISTEGNIDWGLADHPYAYPLTNTTFWNSSGKIQKLITNSENTSIVTMQNINVITNFLQKEEMLTADGEVRPVILSELGYSSSQGEINQAAAFAYAYYAAENNPYINAILLSRQTDAGEEIAQGLALGLSTQGGQHKYIYEVYKNIDQVNSNSYTEFAKSVIGITNWSEVIQPAN